MVIFGPPAVGKMTVGRADLETRLVRNRGEDRLQAKASKRDLAWFGTPSSPRGACAA